MKTRFPSNEGKKYFFPSNRVKKYFFPSNRVKKYFFPSNFFWFQSAPNDLITCLFFWPQKRLHPFLLISHTRPRPSYTHDTPPKTFRVKRRFWGNCRESNPDRQIDSPMLYRLSHWGFDEKEANLYLFVLSRQIVKLPYHSLNHAHLFESWLSSEKSSIFTSRDEFTGRFIHFREKFSFLGSFRHEFDTSLALLHLAALGFRNGYALYQIQAFWSPKNWISPSKK